MGLGQDTIRQERCVVHFGLGLLVAFFGIAACEPDVAVLTANYGRDGGAPPLTETGRADADPSVASSNPRESYGSVAGTIYSLNRFVPVGGVTLTSSNQKTTITREDGRYLLEPVSARDSVWITAHADGFVDTVRVVSVFDGRISFADMLLAEAEVSTPISLQEGGNVQTPSGSIVTIPPGSLCKPGGDPANGAARVDVAVLRPEQGSQIEAVAGTLTTLGSDGEEYLLQPIVVADVTVTQNKQGLAVQANKDIPILLPAPEHGENPTTAALYTLDGETGRWKADGQPAVLTQDPSGKPAYQGK